MEMTSVDQYTKPPTYQVYKQRWIMLLLYVLCGMASTIQGPQYTIIADVVVNYYGVTYEAVNWTMIVFLVAYIVFAFPVVWAIGKSTLRTSVLIGAVGNCVAAWIKVASVSPDRFWVVLLGQSIAAVFQVWLFTLPASVSSTWFGTNQVSTACAIACDGLQIGSGIGFIIATFVVTSYSTIENIEYGLYTMLISTAIFNTAVLLATTVVFKNEPPTPPSPAKQKAKEAADNLDIFKSLKALSNNGGFVVFTLVYGTNLGVYYAISTLLNQIILRHYPNAAKDVGVIGLLMVGGAIVGSIIFGVILDKFHKYKETTIGVLTIIVATLTIFAFTVKQDLIIVYVIMTLLGFFMLGFGATGIEVAAEITYPVEGLPSGIVLISAQLLGIVLTYVYSYLMYNTDDFYANIAMVGCIILSTLFLLKTKFVLRRQLVLSE